MLKKRNETETIETDARLIFLMSSWSFCGARQSGIDIKLCNYFHPSSRYFPSPFTVIRKLEMFGHSVRCYLKMGFQLNSHTWGRVQMGNSLTGNKSALCNDQLLIIARFININMRFWFEPESMRELIVNNWKIPWVMKIISRLLQYRSLSSSLNRFTTTSRLRQIHLLNTLRTGKRKIPEHIKTCFI